VATRKKPVVDIGRIGDVRVVTSTVPQRAEERMMREVEPPTGAEAEALKKRLFHNTRRKSGTGGKAGKFEKSRGRKPRGLLRAGQRSRGKYDFRKVTGLLPLSRAGIIRAACFRDALEDNVRKVYAGQNPGFYTWNLANSATRHEMRAMMMEELLAEEWEELTIEQKLLLVKHLCEASDNRDKVLKEIGLGRLSEIPEEIDPWMVRPELPAELPADVISPPEVVSQPEPDAAEIVAGFKGGGDGKPE
jgi:hypothetical protein